MTDRPDVLHSPFVWQETGVEHYETLTGPVHIIFAHGTFLAKKVVRDETSARQLRRLAHNLPNCLLPEFARIYGSVTVQPSGAVRAVLAELCPLTLHEFIHDLNYQPSKEVLASLALDIANALLYLHQHNMLHGDLVPKSILVTTACSCKMGDLGAPPPPNNVYTAPEVKAGAPIGPKADIYSFGMTAAELATGLPPGKVPLSELMDEIDWDPLRSLLLRCVQDAPEARPEAKEVVEELKRLLASLDVPIPYDLLGYRTALCRRLKESDKLAFFPDLYWSASMADEKAAVARGEALPIQLAMERRLAKVEDDVTLLQTSVEMTNSRMQSLQLEMSSSGRSGGCELQPELPSGRISPPSRGSASSTSDSPSGAATPHTEPTSAAPPEPRPALDAETLRFPPTQPPSASGSEVGPNASTPHTPASVGTPVVDSIDGSPGGRPSSRKRSATPISIGQTGVNRPTVQVDRARLKTVHPDQHPWLRISPNKDAAVRYADAVDDEFNCSMCLEVMENASCLTRCGHSFCQACLKRAIQRKPECPTCRQPGEDCVPNFTLRKLISSLPVRCYYESCPMVMPRSDLDAHVPKCPNAPHKCNVPSSADPHDWCSFVCTKEEERVAHRQCCEYALVQCPYGCGQHFSAKLLAAHEKLCLELPMQCPDCGLGMTRNEFADHLCPNEEIECELCRETMQRRHLAAHMETAARDHVGQLVGIVAEQGRLLRELKAMMLSQATRQEELDQRLASVPRGPTVMQAASVAGGAGGLRVTWHAQMLKSYSLYESPPFECQGYGFAVRLCKATPEAGSGHLHVPQILSNRYSSRSGSTAGQDMYGLFLRSLNDVGVIAAWGVTCSGFRGTYSHFFQEKGSEAGSDGIIPGMDGQRLVVELTVRVTNVILEGGDRRTLALEKYHDKRRRRTVLEPSRDDDHSRAPSATGSATTLRSPT